ncbi:hypothetical protein ND856_16095 [Leptospira bandrabouensis]|uniref:hypothetical protein n=1 Tax=Leptospira bandrabouensis TaxID=2484903 RepID=UPI00223CD2AE|nr:hypothetical protein [Leptospira bandrabouensis]MCW7458436.1 hypothetical protein [Leptospira bandrabouensis]MCW7478817.1 hypothetical protein [Leptospira bandrabouensis]MCW7486519.1 hypothetical protein [Leptospira bandrabouensis]
MRKGILKVLFDFRFYIALYISVVSHITLIIYSFNNSDSPYHKVLCGPPWIYAEEEEKELSFQMNFGKIGGETGNAETSEDSSEGEEGEDGEGNGFSKGKYKGSQWEELVKDLEGTSSLRKQFKNDYDLINENSGVADSYIKRNRDYEDIIVKDVLPTVKGIRDPFRVDIENAEDNLFVHKERNRIIEDFRKGDEYSPLITMRISKEGEAVPKSPLTMTKDDRTRYLDKTLKQKKEKQLDEFISRFMGYDPDKGDLSYFVRDLYYENLQRLAYPFSGDPSYFAIDYFQENLNKEDFLRQMMAALSENLGTNTGTEILFTIENIYEIQSRALEQYFQAKEYLTLATPEQKQTLRYETLRRMSEKYKKLLLEKKLFHPKDVEEAYSKKRVDILDTLIAKTPNGYRKRDGYFEKGRVLWEAGNSRKDSKLQSEALKIWNRISNLPTNGDFLNEKAFESIQLLLRDLGNVSDADRLPLQTKDQIELILRTRLSESMNRKKEREDKLLWPKISQKQKKAEN